MAIVVSGNIVQGPNILWSHNLNYYMMCTIVYISTYTNIIIFLIQIKKIQFSIKIYLLSLCFTLPYFYFETILEWAQSVPFCLVKKI